MNGKGNWEGGGIRGRGGWKGERGGEERGR